MVRLKETKGSALVWVLIICTIFGILGMSIGWVALSMNKRSTENVQNTQAYFTARSGADLIFDYLNGDMEDNSLSKDLYSNLIQGENHSVGYNDIFKGIERNDGTEINNHFGTCNVTATYDGKTVTIISEAIVGSEKETIKLTATRENEGTKWPAPCWAIKTLTGTGGTYILGKVSDRPETSGTVDFTLYRVSEVTSGTLNIEENAQITSTTLSKRYNNQAVFIYVDDKQALTLTGFTTTLKTEYTPDVFIYLGEESTLSITGSSAEVYPFHITMSTKSKLTADKEVKVYSVSGAEDNAVSKVSFDQTKGVPSNLPKSSYAFNGTPVSNTDTDTAKGAKVATWTKGQYEIITQTQ